MIYYDYALPEKTVRRFAGPKVVEILDIECGFLNRSAREGPVGQAGFKEKYLLALLN